jgi:hypothetical protein
MDPFREIVCKKQWLPLIRVTCVAECVQGGGGGGAMDEGGMDALRRTLLGQLNVSTVDCALGECAGVLVVAGQATWGRRPRWRHDAV